MIKKFPFTDRLSLVVTMNPSAKVLMFNFQKGMPTLWIDDAPRDNAGHFIPLRTFILFATGEKSMPNSEHVGSAVSEDGMLVLHCYEVK